MAVHYKKRSQSLLGLPISHALWWEENGHSEGQKLTTIHRLLADLPMDQTGLSQYELE